MATFRIINIQLLPLDTANTPEVGEDGYRNLLRHLKTSVDEAKTSKELHRIAYPLANETLFAPLALANTPTGELGVGEFIKYHRAEIVTDLYTNKNLFVAENPDSAVSGVFHFRFVFDYKHHQLLIEEKNGKLPSAGVIVRAFSAFFTPIASRFFPKYTLTVNIVSEQKALEQALEEATGFKVVDIQVTFDNGHDFNKRLRQLKADNVHSLKIHASSGKDGRMPNLPDFVLDFLHMSVKFGKSRFTYFKDKKSGRQTYSSEDNPKKLRFRQKSDEADISFVRRVALAARPPISSAKNIDRS
jgi:hypothetical protein